MNTHLYHTIELLDGSILEGDYDLREMSKRVFIPDQMKGMRSLDVGSSSGFWSFEMEKNCGSLLMHLFSGKAVNSLGNQQNICFERY